jgi:lipopolysaccharide transport system permease protein
MMIPSRKGPAAGVSPSPCRSLIALPMSFPFLAYCWRLFATLTWTNFKMRYYGSILGYVWSLLKPLALFGVLFFVYSFVFRQTAPHYKLFLLLGIMLWDFFTQATTAGMGGFIGNYQMIRKMYLPRIILVLSTISASFIGLFFNLAVFAIFAFFDGVALHARMLWFFPLLVAFYLLVAGIGLILSIIVVKVRDILSVWEVALQLGFWLTPIIYPMSMVPENLRFYMFLNPVAGIMTYSRYVLVGIGGLTKSGFCYVMVASVLVFLLGILVFKWKEGEMVEDL